MRPEELLRKFDTSDVDYGLLNPEQAERFWENVYDKNPFSELHRKELRRAQSGEIDKIMIGARLLRKKVEGTDDNYRAKPTFDNIEYKCENVKLPWEVTEEVFHQNIEQQALEDRLMNLMTGQVGRDLEDLHFNGDSSVQDNFLSINDGWIVQINSDGHVVPAAEINDGKLHKRHFFALVKAIPRKYFQSGNMRWMMNGITYTRWVEIMTDRATAAGDAALIGGGLSAGGEITVFRPLGFPVVEVPSLADGTIILGDPQNFISVNTWAVRVRRTVEGKTAIMEDKRFYVVYFDDDPIIENPDAVAICEDIDLD